MNKKYFFGLVVGILLLVVGVCSYYRNLPSEYGEVFSTVSELPRVSWWEVRSGRWGRSLLRGFEQSGVGTELQERYVVEDFVGYQDKLVENHGRDGMFVSGDDQVMMQTEGIVRRPYVWVGFAWTMIGEEEYVLLGQIWSKRQGKDRVVVYVVRMEESGRVEEMVSEESSLVVMPVMQYRARDVCEDQYLVGREYCKWQGRWRVVMSYLSSSWQRQERVSVMMGGYPVAPSVINLYTKRQ